MKKKIMSNFKVLLFVTLSVNLWVAALNDNRLAIRQSLFEPIPDWNFKCGTHNSSLGASPTLVSCAVMCVPFRCVGLIVDFSPINGKLMSCYPCESLSSDRDVSPIHDPTPEIMSSLYLRRNAIFVNPKPKKYHFLENSLAVGQVVYLRGCSLDKLDFSIIFTTRNSNIYVPLQLNFLKNQHSKNAILVKKFWGNRLVAKKGKYLKNTLQVNSPFEVVVELLKDCYRIYVNSKTKPFQFILYRRLPPRFIHYFYFSGQVVINEIRI